MNTKTLFLFSLLFVLLLNNRFFAQTVPNGDFENWSIGTSSTLEPDGWTTNNQAGSLTVVPDSSAFSNDLAMKLISSMDVQTYGESVTTIPVSGQLPVQLVFHAKWENIGDAGVGVAVEFYDQFDIPVEIYDWYPLESSSGWTEIVVDFPLTQPGQADDITGIRIGVSAFVGFENGNAQLSVDAMELIYSPSNVEEAHDFEIELFPNPANFKMHVSSAASIIRLDYQILDIQGKIIQEGKVKEVIPVNDLEQGQYVLQIMSNKDIFRKKFVISR